MTKDEIFAWAESRGFSLNEAGNEMSIPYREAQIVLRAIKRSLKVILRYEDGELRLATVTPSSPAIHINEDGMLEGIGLSTSFVQRFCPDLEKPGRMPPWFTEGYANKMLEAQRYSTVDLTRSRGM